MSLNGIAFACIIAIAFQPFDLQAQSTNTEIPKEAQNRLDHTIGRWNFRTDLLTRDGSELVAAIEAVSDARQIDGKRLTDHSSSL